jgi:hypothetical protein
MTDRERLLPVINSAELHELRAVLVKEADHRVALSFAKARSYLHNADDDLKVTEINHRVALETNALQHAWEMARIEVEVMWMRLGILPPGWTNRPERWLPRAE